MPDISTVNGIDAGSLASFSGVTVEDGQTVDGQTFAFAPEAHTLISSTTISSSVSSVSITSTDLSGYDIYEIRWKNMHPSSSGWWQFQGNASGQSGFNEYMNTTYWTVYTSSASYWTGGDQGNSSSATVKNVYQRIGYAYSTANSSSTSGVLVTDKYTFWSTGSRLQDSSNTNLQTNYVSGYFSQGFVELDFKFSSGNIDAGQIDLYGVSTS